MTDVRQPRSQLWVQLDWFVALRWVAAGGVVAGALLDRLWLGRYGHAGGLLAVGGAVAIYNALLLLVLRLSAADGSQRRRLVVLAWVHILLDLACLTLLTLWTGGLRSPLLGFFVFHMVFASLLLRRAMALTGAAVAVAMLGGALWAWGEWPTEADERLLMAGWAITLFFTVGLTSRITRDLRRQRRRLIRQNRHIRLMSQRLRRQQQAMIQHEKMAAMGQMAAGVAHEIANPLASMDSLLQLIQRRPERLSAETAQTLREQVDRISQIVRQMTTFAHPADNQWQTLPLSQIVENALEMVRFDHRLRKVEVQRELSDEAGAVHVLPQAIQQVLVNLILNALDAMSEAAVGPRLTLRTRRSGAWCVIEVTDNGHGIRPEHLDRLFEPFFTTKPVGKGTGLGLSISYSLVRKQGGRIDVRSELGQGATFTVRLPAVTAASESSRNREDAERGIAASGKTHP